MLESCLPWKICSNVTRWSVTIIYCRWFVVLLFSRIILRANILARLMLELFLVLQSWKLTQSLEIENKQTHKYESTLSLLPKQVFPIDRQISRVFLTIGDEIGNINVTLPCSGWVEAFNWCDQYRQPMEMDFFCARAKYAFLFMLDCLLLTVTTVLSLLFIPFHPPRSIQPQGNFSAHVCM